MSMFHELMMRKKEQIMYATIKGSLTENDGVFSGFSESNYLQLQQPFTLSPTTKAEFDFKINISSLTNNNAIFGSITNYGLYVGVNSSGNLELFVGDNSSWIVTQTGTTTLSVSTDYDIKLNINNNIATLYINGNIELTANLGLVSSNTYDIGVGRGITTSDYFRGSIDLNNSYVKVGVKYKLQAVVGYTIVGSPTITDGVASGFSSANYLELPSIPANSYNKIEIHTKIKLNNVVQGNIITTNDTRYQGIYVRSNLRIGSFMQLGSTGYPLIYDVNLIANQDYIIDFIIDTENLYTKLIVNNSDKSATITVTNKRELLYLLGYGVNGALNGEIYLKDTWIKKDNKLWFNGQQA